MRHQPKIFDVTILGTGLGGLIAATRLAKENRSVLLLKEGRYRLSFKRDGYCFVPFSNFSEKRVKRRLLKTIPGLISFLESGKRQDKLGQMTFAQVVLPEGRIDLYQKQSLLQKEWRREFQGEWGLIEDFYTRLERIRQDLKKIEKKEPPGSFFPIRNPAFIKRWLTLLGLPKVRLDQWLSSFSPKFKKFIELQLIAYGNLLPHSFPLSLVSYLLLNEEEEEWEMNIDLDMIVQGMLEVLIQSGGKVEEIEEVEKIEMKGGKGFSFSLKGDERNFRSKSLILNSPLHHLFDLFGRKGKGLSKKGKKIRPLYVLIPFFFGIREKVIPVGMGDLLISILDLEKKFEGGNLLLISLSSKGKENQAPEGKRALTVQSFMPFGGLDRDFISHLQEGVVRHLKYLFPFLEHHIDFIEPHWADDQIRRWSYPHYYYEMNPDAQWRRGVIPIRISKNLYFSGRENFPYLGIEGEILSGRMIGEKISKKYN